jgi:integration host factor subunit alpha
MALTKADLTDLLFENIGLNKREAKEIVESFYDEMCATLQEGDGVKLSGFGNFQLRSKPERPGRNPKTGEEIPISARRVVTFHASQKLKTMVENHYHGQSKPSESLPPIPAKRYFTIGEVSELCLVKPHVLRYWEQEFTQLNPIKRRNRRYYQHQEVILIRRIRELLYDQASRLVVRVII